jgi:hypothetical protein
LAQPPTVYGSASFTVFWRQCEGIAKHDDGMLCEKATYLIEPAAHILHGVPTGATYKKVNEALENCYIDF